MGKGRGEREKGNPKQTPHCAGGQRGALSHDPEILTLAKVKSWILHPLGHPGAPPNFELIKRRWVPFKREMDKQMGHIHIMEPQLRHEVLTGVTTQMNGKILHSVKETSHKKVTYQVISVI